MACFKFNMECLVQRTRLGIEVTHVIVVAARGRGNQAFVGPASWVMKPCLAMIYVVKEPEFLAWSTGCGLGQEDSRLRQWTIYYIARSFSG